LHVNGGGSNRSSSPFFPQPANIHFNGLWPIILDIKPFDPQLLPQ